MSNDVAVTGSRDTGNSPKNKFVQEIAVALETGVFLKDGFGDSLTWIMNDQHPVSGDALREAIHAVERPVSITVDHAISHGKVGAANGEAVMKDGRVRRFAHIMNFTNTKANIVAKIDSFSCTVSPSAR